MLPEGVNEGVAIYKVENGSPAAKAGLKKGDIITKVSGHITKNLAEFRYELYKHNPGENIEITYYRSGEEKTTTITLSKNME